MPNWTQAQTAAITVSGRDLLVSAAAGSGKTAALTERILRHIKSGAKLDRFLVVTFSRASAADMRSKLTRELKRAAAEDPSDKTIAKALTELSGTKIGTIHSFCLSVLKKYHARLSLPPKMRVADDAEAKLMKTECMEETIEHFFSLSADEEMSEEFIFLTDHLLGGEADDKLSASLLSLYEKTVCLPKRYEALLDSADELSSAAEDGKFLLTDCGRGIGRRLSRELSYYESIFRAAVTEFSVGDDYIKKYLPAFVSLCEFVSSCLSLLREGDYDGIGEKFRSFKNPTLGAIKGEKSPETEFYKVKKTEFGKFVTESAARFFSVSGDALAVTLRRTARVTRAVVSVLSEFDRRYSAEKRRVGLLDYEDLEHFTLKLLSDSETAKMVSADYDEIYIDECQDVNAVQNSIFEAIARENRFMVGDVKQSIYAFRGADPTLFDSYRKKYTKISSSEDGDKGEGGAAVFMSDNFRCDRSVIEFTNAVCGAIMPHGNVSYTEDDELRHGKAEPDSEAFPVRVILSSDTDEDEADEADEIDKADEIGASKESTEAEAVADEVARLLREEKRRDGESIAPSDIAILLRSAKGKAEVYENALRARGIPVSNDTTPNFFECPEVLLALSILYTIDDPLRDIYLAGALRSPVFGFTLDDLIKLGGGELPLYRRLRDMAENAADDGELSEKCRYAYRKILRWRELARGASSAEMIADVYRETGLEALVWSEVNRHTGVTPPEVRAENLDSLFMYARNYEANSHMGLHRFLDYINNIIERDVKAQVEVSDRDGQNTVKIMTLHQSKGLEFPVTVIAGCGSKRNEQDAKESLLFDKAAGLAMRLRADDGGVSPIMLETLPRRAVMLSIFDTLAAEEMRLLYVGLTRARERLIISAKLPDAEKFIEKRRREARFFSEHTAYAEKSYIGWILSALFLAQEKGCDISEFCEIVTLNSDGGKEKVISGASDRGEAFTPDPERVREYREILEKRFSYVYPYKKLGALPAKLAVSDLSPTILDDEDAAVLETETKKEPMSPEAERAAAAGTATHIFMQFCDFENAERNGVDGEIERLVRCGFIRQSDAELIRRDEAERFFRSEIYGKMKSAKNIWRERRFNLRLPASEFTEDAENRDLYSSEEVLVQGVIDCFFEDENGEVSVIDYKTDRLTPYEISHPRAAKEKLLSRHKTQLGYYGAAVGEMFGAPPKHIYIYSLPLGDTVEI